MEELLLQVHKVLSAFRECLPDHGSSVASTSLRHHSTAELSFLRKQESIDFNFHSWGWSIFAHERLQRRENDIFFWNRK